MKGIKTGVAFLALLALVGITGAVAAVTLTARRIPAAQNLAVHLGADTAMVLGAAVWGEEPSPVLSARLDAALVLWQQGKVNRIVLTGGASAPGVPTEAEVSARYLEQRGVPGEALLLETWSRNTAGNMAGAADLLMGSGGILAESGDRRVVLVSHDLHLYRAMLMARDVGLEPVPAAVPIRYRNPVYTAVREALALVPYWAWQRWQLRGYSPGSILLADLVAILLLALLFQTAQAIGLLRSLRRFSGARALSEAAGVSIILPVKGLDPGAEAHYRHWLAQDPGVPWEVIFSLQDPADPALAVITPLAQAAPHRVRVLVNPVREGLHGKSSNLWHGVQAARYPQLVMADSDVDPPPHLLRGLLARLAEPGVGMVAALPVGLRSRGFWGHLNAYAINISFGLFWAPGQEWGSNIGAPGACVAIHRSALAAAGGIEGVGSYVAEDARLAMAVSRAGYRVALGPAVPLEVGAAHRQAVVSLVSRGAYMVKRMYPLPLRLAVPLVFLAPYLLFFGGLLTHDGLLAGAGGLLLVARWVLGGAFQVAAAPSEAGTVLLAPVLDALALVVWLQALITDETQWRGIRYRVQADGRLERIA